MRVYDTECTECGAIIDSVCGECGESLDLAYRILRALIKMMPMRFEKLTDGGRETIAKAIAVELRESKS